MGHSFGVVVDASAPLATVVRVVRAVSQASIQEIRTAVADHSPVLSVSAGDVRGMARLLRLADSLEAAGVTISFNEASDGREPCPCTRELIANLIASDRETALQLMEEDWLRDEAPTQIAVPPSVRAELEQLYDEVYGPDRP